VTNDDNAYLLTEIGDLLDRTQRVLVEAACASMRETFRADFADALPVEKKRAQLRQREHALAAACKMMSGACMMSGGACKMMSGCRMPAAIAGRSRRDGARWCRI
jgi:hypothetical protein